MTHWLRRVLREPLVHFVVSGVAVFALDRAVSKRQPKSVPPPPVASRAAVLAPPDGSIVVDAGVRASVSAAFVQAEGRAPDDKELRRAVDAWVEEEILFREGVKRGLERDDPKVRQRVSAKLLTVLRAGIVLSEPTEEELLSHHASHRDKWDTPVLIDFVQVFVQGTDAPAKKRASDFLTTLSGGGDPGGLGDPFPGGRRYRMRSIAELTATFGDAFTRGATDLPLDTWQLRESRFGLHLVRIEKRTQGVQPAFADVRADVAADLYLDRRSKALAARVQQLREGHVIVVKP